MLWGRRWGKRHEFKEFNSKENLRCKVVFCLAELWHTWRWKMAKKSPKKGEKEKDTSDDIAAQQNNNKIIIKSGGRAFCSLYWNLRALKWESFPVNSPFVYSITTPYALSIFLYLFIYCFNWRRVFGLFKIQLFPRACKALPPSCIEEVGLFAHVSGMRASASLKTITLGPWNVIVVGYAQHGTLVSTTLTSYTCFSIVLT